MINYISLGLNMARVYLAKQVVEQKKDCYSKYEGEVDNGIEAVGNMLGKLVCTLTRPRMLPYENPKLESSKRRILGTDS